MVILNKSLLPTSGIANPRAEAQRGRLEPTGKYKRAEMAEAPQPRNGHAASRCRLLKKET